MSFPPVGLRISIIVSFYQNNSKTIEKRQLLVRRTVISPISRHSPSVPFNCEELLQLLVLYCSTGACGLIVEDVVLYMDTVVVTRTIVPNILLELVIRGRSFSTINMRLGRNHIPYLPDVEGASGLDQNVSLQEHS